MAEKIELGDTARDTITGFEGVVVGHTQWIHGCVRLTIQPRTMKDGKPIDPMSFDEPQLELVSKRTALSTNATGGPRPEPKRSHIGSF